MNGTAEPEADFLLDDAPANAAEAPAAATPWRVLIVDDDESVHSISRVVLADVHFQGRGVEILSAYSGRQAAAMLRVIPAALFDDWFDPGAPGEGDDAVGKFCEFVSGVMTCP